MVQTFVYEVDLTADARLHLTQQWRLVTTCFSSVTRLPLTWSQRGEHCIDDELVFSNYAGYIFHDSQGIEAGDEERLEILKDFIRRKCGEDRLQDKLHAIWFVQCLRY